MFVGEGCVLCVLLLCHRAWGVLRVSWVQVSSEGVEWGAGFHRATPSLAGTACLFIMKAGSFKPAILYFLPLKWGSGLGWGLPGEEGITPAALPTLFPKRKA